MTPTTSTLHRDSWLHFPWPRESGSASGPISVSDIAASRALPGCRGGRRRVASRSVETRSGVRSYRASSSVRRVGETCSDWEGVSAPERWKSLRGAIFQVGSQTKPLTRKPAKVAQLYGPTGCGPSLRPQRNSLPLPLEAGRGSELWKALERKGRPRGGIESPRGWGLL